MPTFELRDVTFSYSESPLLDGISLTVGSGERACLVGPNGSGKTTLLRIAAGGLSPAHGEVRIREGVSLSSALVPDPSKASGTVKDYLDEALKDVRNLLKRFDELAALIGQGSASRELNDEYDELLSRLITLDAWSLDTQVNETLAGLGLENLSAMGTSRLMRELSPGQQRRVELAALILSKPTALILDEPTNHLDEEATAYLVDKVMNWPGPVLFASHDRAFIEAVATVIYDLDTGVWQALVTAAGGGKLPGAYRCRGNYSNYLVEKRRANAEHQKIHAAQQGEKKEIRMHRRLSEDIALGGVRLATAEGKARKFFSDRAAATSVRRTRGDDQRLEDLARIEVRKPRNYSLSIALPDVKARPGLAVSARNATVRVRLRPTTFDLSYGEHLLITGANGAGKTTLLNWIAFGAPPSEIDAISSGTISVSAKVAHVPQQLPKASDPGFNMKIWEGGIGELGSGILHPSMWHTAVPDLSDGNQRRAQIATAVSEKAEILVIDEPTNYLDLATIEALEDALESWGGTLIVASHDRWLIDHWEGRRLNLEPI